LKIPLATRQKPEITHKAWFFTQSYSDPDVLVPCYFELKTPTNLRHAPHLKNNYEETNFWQRIHFAVCRIYYRFNEAHLFCKENYAFWDFRSVKNNTSNLRRALVFRWGKFEKSRFLNSKQYSIITLVLSAIVFTTRVYYPIDHIYMTFVESNLKVWHSQHVYRYWLTERISYLIFTFVSNTWGANFICCSDSLVLAMIPKFVSPIAYFT
jgi:hypothetical protein